MSNLKEQVIELLSSDWSEISHEDAVRYVAMYYDLVYLREKPKMGSGRHLSERIAQAIVLLAFPSDEDECDEYDDEG